MTVLVTGAAGYVGNNTVRRQVELGKPVRAMVRSQEKAQARLGDLGSKIELVQGDVENRALLKQIMRDVSAVVHLVAIPMEKGRATYEEINYQGTINVVDAARDAGVERLINMCQNGARPDHFSRFLRSKGRAQEYVAKSGLKWTAVRPSVIFGPQDEFLNDYARLIRLTPVVYTLIGGGSANTRGNRAAHLPSDGYEPPAGQRAGWCAASGGGGHGKDSARHAGQPDAARTAEGAERRRG